MNHVRAIFLLFVVFFISLAFVTGSLAEERKICGQDPSVLGGDEGWTLEKEGEGIQIYLRKTSISPIKVFRGVSEFDVEFSRMVALIWDGEAYTDWLLLCNEAKLLDEVNDTEQYLYTMNQPMWPVKKRDNICHRTIFQDPETLAVTIEMCLDKDYIPEKKGRIRVPFLTGYGKMTPLENGKTELVYEVLVDVGGWVPNWIINFYQANTAYITFQNLKKLLPLEKYKDVRYGFIKYPEEKKCKQPVVGMLKESDIK